MANSWWNDDHRLLANLGEAVHDAATVPQDFIDAGKAAYMLRDIDSELAALTYDSAHEPALTRADTASLRALTFATARLTIELEVTEDCLIGQVVPPGVAQIEVQTSTGEAQNVTADELGCFAISHLPRGPFRLQCRVGTLADVFTQWITL